MEERPATGAESEEGERLCAELSLCEDQVPAVGQQTEIGEESGDEGEEEDVVSSLTLCEPESGVSDSTASGQSSMSQHQEMVEGEGASSAGRWYLYAHGTTNADTRVCRDIPTDVHPDSVQQEEAVTTSSELTAITVPLHGHADSSLSTNKHVVRTGVDGGNDSVDLGRGASINLVNYDSSDSDDSSVKTPRLENLQEEEGRKFQYPDSNSLPLKTEDQKDVNISSSCVGESDAAGEKGQGVGEESVQSEGYWNEQGYWVDSQGQVWQPQGQDAYWQGQWSQQTEGQGGDWHGADNQSTAVQRYDSQGQWQSQESVETQSKQAVDVQEQTWSSEQDGQEGSQGSAEGTQQQQSTSNQQAQGQYSSHNYYQQQYAGQQYDNSASESQYYDHAAYYGQDRYTTDATQQQVKAEGGTNTSDPVSTQSSKSTYPEAGESNTHQQSSYPQPTNQVNYGHYQNSDASQDYGDFAQNREWSQTQGQQNQGHYGHAYNPAQSQGQPEQAQYGQDHKYGHQDQVKSCDPATQAQHYDQSHCAQQHQGQPYSQQGQYAQQGSMQQQAQPYNHTQPYSHRDQYNHQQSYGPQDQVQYRQQQEIQSHSSYNQQSYDGWYQQSAQQGYGSQPHNQYSSGGPQESGNWRGQGGNDGSYYHYSEQQSEGSGYHTWEQPPHQQQQQYYNQHYGSQQGYGAQNTHTGGYNNQTPPVVPPPTSYHQNNPHPSPPLPPPPPLPSHPHVPPPPPHITPPPPPPHHFPPPFPHPHTPQPPPPHPLPPSPPSQLHHHSRNYSSRTQPSWQHRDHNDWKKWKYNRRESSQTRGSHQSPSGIPSSPVNSVSSDVSSTSRDSPTPVQPPSGADSPEDSDRRSSKPVFSNQLRDPRRSSSPTSSGDKSSPRISKHTSTTSSLVRKRSAPQKQPERSSPAGTPDSSSVKTEKSGKENKDKASSGEPQSFPKNSLSGFRIPKHSKSTGQSQAQSESRTKTVPVTGRKCEPTQALNNSKVKETGNSSKETREQKISTSEKLNEKNKEVVSSAPAVHPDVVSLEAGAKVKETAKVKSDKDSSTQPSEDTSRQDLVSLFKSIDDSTLHALASTIKLALNSSNSQHVSATVESKVSSASATATESSEHKEPPKPADVAKVKEKSPVPSSSASVTVQEATKENVEQQTTPTDSSAVIAEEVLAENTKQNAPSKTSSESFSQPTHLGAGARRMVIATVLSRSAGTSSLPTSVEASHTPKKGPLTVCIPIRKEVKVQISKLGSKVEEKGAAKVSPATPPPSETVKQEKNDEPSHESESTVPRVRSPTLSLLSAQEVMFDPKYMYKEYNLRRVRKQEVPQEQSPPQQKKQKLEKPKESPVPANEDTERMEAPDKEELPTGRRKRGRLQAALTEPGAEAPESKKPKSADEEALEPGREDESIATQSSDNSTVQLTRKNKKLLLSLPRSRPHSSSPPPLTLTQLLSTKKPVVENSKQTSTSPKKVASKLLKDKAEKKALKSPRLLPHTSDIHPTRTSKSHSRSQLFCTLCKEKGGVLGLGFLFGPYRYHADAEGSDGNSSVEVWLHEDCCVWAPGVCLVGRELHGIREALTDANKMVCAACKNVGATLCCASRGCKNTYHFPCAVEKGCVLNEEQFQTYCPKHKENMQVD